MLYVTDDTVNATLGKEGSGVEFAQELQYVTSIPSDDLSHTFTVSNADGRAVNVPVPPSATVTVMIQFKSGTYNWQCLVPCGLDAASSPGWGGAMATAGWMTGQVIAS